ncbi:MAG: glycosyltransferase [Actinobacteria bacterium]|nr:MAG: glycosyltransferase [Actinomycetota bacterium]
MIALRFLGAAFAGMLLIGSVLQHRRRHISRLSLIITWVVGVTIIVLAVAPNAFNPMFELFRFREGGGQRLIGVLLFANVLVFLLLFRNMSAIDSATRSIRLLIEALAWRSFDRSQLKDLPEVQRILVVLPAYNEAGNVGSVLHAMPEEVDGYPVMALVVDDASEDATAEAARAAGALVARLPIRRGGGLALRVGYEIALQLDTAVVVTMDADGQHVPDEMPLLIKPILSGEADMVNGSRVLGEFERESLMRHIGVHVFSRLVTVLTGSRVTDVSNGYRAIRTDVLKGLVLDQDQFWAAELLIEAMRQRLRIVEVPITVRARISGASKKPKTFRYARHFTKAIIQTWLR